MHSGDKGGGSIWRRRCRCEECPRGVFCQCSNSPRQRLHTVGRVGAGGERQRSAREGGRIFVRMGLYRARRAGIRAGVCRDRRWPRECVRDGAGAAASLAGPGSSIQRGGSGREKVAREDGLGTRSRSL